MESIQKKLEIIYHFPCYDGAFAAINTYLYYKNFSKTQYDITFKPIKNFVSKKEFLIGFDKIIILDLNLSEDEYDALMENQDISVLMIDHHISGIKLHQSIYESKLKARKKPIKTIFDDKNYQSACGLSFNYFKKKASFHYKSYFVEPVYSNKYLKIIKYVEDGDTGSNSLKNIYQFKSGLSRQYHPIESVTDFSGANGLQKINNLLDLNLTFTIRTGEKSFRMFRSKANSLMLRSKVYVLQLTEEWKFLAIISEEKKYRNYICPILGKISKKCGYLPTGAMIYHEDKELFKVSFRTSEKNACDVSEIASKFGGGGHADAAGFTKTLPEIKQYIVKEINVYNDILLYTK